MSDKRIIEDYCKVNNLNTHELKKHFDKERGSAKQEFIKMAKQNIYESQHE